MERKEKRQPDHSSLRHDIGNRGKLTREACDSHLRIPLRTPGTSSTVNGYAAGSNVNGAPETTIEKFPISSDTNSSDVGDLALGRYGAAGQQV